jgi:hypothetical protein
MKPAAEINRKLNISILVLLWNFSKNCAPIEIKKLQG